MKDKIISEYKKRISSYLNESKILADYYGTKDSLDTILGFLKASGVIDEAENSQIISEARVEALQNAYEIAKRCVKGVFCGEEMTTFQIIEKAKQMGVKLKDN